MANDPKMSSSRLRLKGGRAVAFRRNDRKAGREVAADQRDGRRQRVHLEHREFLVAVWDVVGVEVKRCREQLRRGTA